jgi:type VI secretion system protein ImpK
MSQPGRISAEGRADSEPVAPNDTPANRARNRRVEITLLVAPAAAGAASAAPPGPATSATK